MKKRKTDGQMEENANPSARHDAAAGSPRTETEGILLEIWSEMLNAGGFGIHDDFLSLGGDSLSAMRCINRITAVYGVELPLDIFLLDAMDISHMGSELDRIRCATA